MSKSIGRILPLLFCLLSLLSIEPYCTMRFGNQAYNYIVEILILIIICNNIRNYKNKDEYRCKWVWLFFFWAMLGALRGGFIAENYWDWKNLVGGSLCMILVLSVIYFFKPENVQIILYKWFKYCIPLLFIIMWFMANGAVHYFASPVLIFGCFIPILSKKWKVLLGAIVVLMLFGDIGARSQVLSALSIICIASLIFLYRRGHQNFVLFMAKKVQILFFVAPFIFLTLAFSGKYNVFEGFYNSQHGKYSASRIENDGDKVEYDAAADTRTFIYVDVIASALNNDYVLMGRTLARGNDCSYSRFADETYYLTRRYERYANEVGMTNIFTWLGLIGLFFYIMIYLNASLKGMYKSNNIYIKCLSCLLAYHCMYGWVENYPAFTMHTVTLWMLIGMCASPMFREMTDMEFESWLMKIFKR